MPNQDHQDQYLSYVTQYKRLKDKQEIMPANLNEFDKTKQQNQAFIQHNSIEETKTELAFIDKLLSGNYMKEEVSEKLPERFRLKLTEEDYMLLSNRKTMGLSNILLNNNTKEDSKEMTNVKIDILNFAKVMESCKALPPTSENLDMVDVAIRMAIDSCISYCNNKHPKFKTGIARKEMVKEVYQSLIEESELFSLKRREMAKGNKEIKLPQTIGELFGLSSQGAIERPMTKKEVKEAQKRERQQANNANNQAGNQAAAAPKITYPEEVKFVKEIFGERYNFAEKIKAKYKTDKEIKARSREVKALYDSLKLFTPGNVAIRDVKVLGKNAKLLQKSDNSTYIIVDHKEYPLDRTFATTCNQIENEIFNNSEVYGNDQLEKLLNEFEKKANNGKMTSGENNRIRTMLSEYLNIKTGLAVNDFNNTFRSDMVNYIKDILRGRAPSEIKNEVEENSKSNLFINGVAVSEMVMLNSKKSIDEIKEMVEMNTQEQKVVLEPGWEEGEQKVKNLISDLIYSNDTEKMDASLKNPGAYIRDMLDKHKDALKAIKDSKTDPEAFIKGILQKMSLDNLSANVNGYELKLDGVLSQAMAVLIDFAEDGEIQDDQILMIKKELDQAVDKSCQILQQNVSDIAGVIFEKVPQDENYDDMTLKQKVSVISKSAHGQGLFTENVFNSYFAKMNNVDKRAMLAAVIRTAKKVPDSSAMKDDDLIDEIKASKPVRFIKTFEKIKKEKQDNGKESYQLDDEQKEALRAYREFRHNVKIQANFMAGLIRGAGPLMHKMMQGMPTANLPEEIQEALSDVKDNLPPIPEHIVKAEFMSLVESSHGNITKIKKEKSLGAASVGETFLCKVYGPRPDMKNGKEVVIKLIRPEAKNRMQREEAVMLEAAQKTDKAMYLTYKGQLENYKKELDLSVEARNCNEGVKNYTGKFDDVKTMKVMDGVPATSSALIVEKAEGVTLKKYIKDLWNYSDELLGEYYSKEEEDGIVTLKKSLPAHISQEMRADLQKKQKLLIQKIEDAKKKRDHIINLCDAWIEQAIMNDKSGFYHGDLHSGNIMINDKEATFIDYGNTVQLTQKQQVSISQMALAATCSVAIPASDNPVELFFNAFNDLITENQNQEFNDMYTEEKKKNLKDAFAEILREGSEEEAGYRISLCLAKAQELGIMLPAAVQNFSQGQVRLQNSLDEMNAAIEYLEKSLTKIDTAGYMDQETCDPVTHMIAKVGNNTNITNFVEGFKGNVNSILPVDETTFKTALVDNTKKKGNAEKGIKAVDKRADFMRDYTDKYAGLKNLKADELLAMGLSMEQLKELGFDTTELKPVKTFKEKFMEYYNAYKDNMDDPGKKNGEVNLLMELIPESCFFDHSLDAFGGQQLLSKKISDALMKVDKDLMEECLQVYENLVPKALLLMKKTNTLWSKQDAKKLSEDEKNQLTGEIYATYNELHNASVKDDTFFTSISVLLDSPHYEDILDEHIKPLFAIEHGELGKKLQEKFEAYKAIKKRNPIQKVSVGTGYNNEWVVKPEDSENYKKAASEFMDAYAEVSKYCLKEYVQDMYSKETSVKYVDYNTVMKNVMNRKLPLENGGIKEKLGALQLIGTWLGTKSKDMVKEVAIANGVHPWLMKLI